jgi:hypothetical protein
MMVSLQVRLALVYQPFRKIAFACRMHMGLNLTPFIPSTLCLLIPALSQALLQRLDSMLNIIPLRIKLENETSAPLSPIQMHSSENSPR